VIGQIAARKMACTAVQQKVLPTSSGQAMEKMALTVRHKLPLEGVSPTIDQKRFYFITV